MFKVGEQVSKVNVGGKVGSATVYEVATATPLADVTDAWLSNRYADEEALYTLRKVGGKGKGGCYYASSQLVAAN